ncbi:low-affinity phosphate transporter [Malassezia sp. CBS 17886]|nr:low-affinity phosphate transporter [Malassezia sp. CBS 17886]
MKFSHSLQLNSVPEWSDKYINYQNLKKLLYSLERVQYTEGDVPSAEQGLENESETLLGPSRSDTDRVFVAHLDKELRKIVDFYCDKEKELSDELALVRTNIQLAEDEYDGYASGDTDGDADGADADDSAAEAGRRKTGVSWHPARRRGSHASQGDVEAAALLGASPGAPDASPVFRRWMKTFGKRGTYRHRRHQSNSDASDFDLPPPGNASAGGGSSIDCGYTVWTSPDPYAVDMRITLRRQLTELYTYLSELQQYAQLNLTGMKKILKKYDKTTNSRLRDAYIGQMVLTKYPFQTQAAHRVEEYMDEIVYLYGRVVTRGDDDKARTQLQSQLREEVVWQRNTVWREMINIERRAQAASLETSRVGAADTGAPGTPQVALWTPCGRVRLPPVLTPGVFQLVFSVALFVALLKLPGLQLFDHVEEQNCFALLVLCTCLWVTEVIPLFATSLLVPFLLVTLRVVREPQDGVPTRLSAAAASRWVFAQMLAPSVLLLLGGFTLAAALSKYNIDKLLATRVLRYAGTRPSVVLLAHMFVACFASMWISNVAAPVLLFSLVQPILRNLPPKSTYATSLVTGIALASNIGGQTSPIASPQNLIALEYMKEPLGWLQWFAITIPVSGLSLVVLWLLVLWTFGTNRGITIKRIPESTEPMSRTQWFIAAVCIGTIVLWCLERRLEWIVGDMAVIALVPIVLFFGSGVLTKEDFNNFLWTIVFLAMGGIALGKGVASSGLLDSLDALVQHLVRGLPLWGVLSLLVLVCLVVATFISHTIAAVLLIPIATQMGESLPTPHPRLLIMVTTLTASAAMGLPISGFPNMTAINLEDEVGRRYVTVRTFLRVGVPASILATAIIGSVGYMMMSLLGL